MRSTTGRRENSFLKDVKPKENPNTKETITKQHQRETPHNEIRFVSRAVERTILAVQDTRVHNNKLHVTAYYWLQVLHAAVKTIYCIIFKML